MDGQARRVHIARAHIPDGTRGRDRRAAGAYPARNEIPAAQETAAQDGCHEHPRTRQHTPTPRRGRRAAFRRLGDGPDCRQGAEKRAADAHREEHELHTHALRPGQKAGDGGRRGMEDAVAVQGARPEDDNHRQRHGIRRTPHNRQEARHYSLFRGLLLRLAERGRRERQQTHQKVHP